MKKYVTINEAAEFLNLKVSRLRYELFHKRIPFYKVGRTIMFDTGELIEWVTGQRGK